MAGYISELMNVSLDSYVSTHLFNYLSCLSMHPSSFLLTDPYMNIARHLSDLTTYRIEETSIKLTAFVIHNWSCKLFFVL